MDRRLAGIALFATALAVAACSPGFGQLKVDEVRPLLHKDNVYVFDNNGQERYDAGHLPGAVRLNSKDIKPADLPADKKNATLIFYCANEG